MKQAPANEDASLQRPLDRLFSEMQGASTLADAEALTVAPSWTEQRDFLT